MGGYNRRSFGFLLLSNITEWRGAGDKLRALRATTFGKWRDRTGGDKITARGCWFHGSIGRVVPQADNELDGVTNVGVGSIRINPQGSRKFLVQDRGSRQQLLSVHQEEVRMAAERDFLEGSDHNGILRYIFVFDGYKYFAITVCGAHTLDELRSSPRAVVVTREAVQEPGKSSNRSPGPGHPRDANHVLVDLRVDLR